MKRGIRYIEWLLSSMLILLLLTGCASSSYEEGEELPQEKPVLKIYLFAPDSPIVTRSEIGKVDATDEEKSINTLDVWAFKVNTDDLVGYIHLSNQTFDGQKEIAMEISDDFATNPTNIDIYVAANVMISNCGLNLGRNVTQADLTNALIADKTEGDFFGVTTPVMSVPVEGLPMSGLLKDQLVTGSAPVLAAKTRNVQLVRAVSKVRFVFCRPAESTDLSITGVGINANMIPNQEYVFLGTDGRTFRVGSSYNTAAISLPGTSITADNIAVCRDASKYFYTSQGAQEYEDLINKGVSGEGANATNTPELTQVGPFYFRETDKKLGGTISYAAGGEKSTDFSIQASGDFSRNRSWIVFAYYEGLTGLQINVVDVTQWEDTESNHEVYNW